MVIWMPLVCTHASLATVEELFTYKANGFELPPFPGYSTDQWGIKAHNRPWVAAHGEWRTGQRIIELGGAYSTLSGWLGDRYGVEPWVGDDFGRTSGEDIWGRWGDYEELPAKRPGVHYQFDNFGPGSPYESDFFDRIFSVSTLEHIPMNQRLGVLQDAHRALAPGGLELHTIDIPTLQTAQLILAGIAEKVPILRSLLIKKLSDGIAAWWALFSASGVRMDVPMPSTVQLLDRRILVESPDVVYRFYPPVDAPSPYHPSASLLLVIRDLR